jgi:hypothetical protein
VNAKASVDIMEYLLPADKLYDPKTLGFLLERNGKVEEPRQYSTRQIWSIARAAHEMNKAYCELHGEPQPGWEVGEEWQHKMSFDNVKYLLEHPDAAAGALHEVWCAALVADDWKVGPVKDPIAKTHHCLVDFDKLPPYQQRKDALYVLTVRELAKDLEPAG